jgi:glycerol transport system ATP-binding protein
VVRVDDVGRYRVVKLDLDGHPFNAIADEDAEIRDDRASVVFEPANVHIYANGRLVEGQPLAAGAA